MDVAVTREELLAVGTEAFRGLPVEVGVDDGSEYVAADGTTSEDWLVVILTVGAKPKRKFGIYVEKSRADIEELKVKFRSFRKRLEKDWGLAETTHEHQR